MIEVPGLLLLAAILLPIIAVELDIARFRMIKWMHPKTTFGSCMLLIAFAFGLAYITNTCELPRAWGVAAFVTEAIVWLLYVQIRTRHMWR